ncbi:MAG: HpcH/HpaI aldolase/citrate lyase family protein [Sphingopyxis sp.]
MPPDNQQECSPMRPSPAFDIAPVSLLYVPGHKGRALEKARGLAADMLIIDLEDAVPAAEKPAARAGALAAMQGGFPHKIIAVRINARGTAHHEDDLALLATIRPDAVVLPKVDRAQDVAAIAGDWPIFAMVETALAIQQAEAIAAHERVVGLLAGLNDLAHDLQLPSGAGGAAGQDRGAMMVAMQTMILAARAAKKLVYDGVYNAIDDAPGFSTEAAEGYRLGFDGKTLIHPAQIGPCNTAFAPPAAVLAEAAALIAAATDGAERYDGRMIEAMHVDAARRMIDRHQMRHTRRTAMVAA